VFEVIKSIVIIYRFLHICTKAYFCACTGPSLLGIYQVFFSIYGNRHFCLFRLQVLFVSLDSPLSVTATHCNTLCVAGQSSICHCNTLCVAGHPSYLSVKGSLSEAHCLPCTGLFHSSTCLSFSLVTKASFCIHIGLHLHLYQSFVSRARHRSHSASWSFTVVFLFSSRV